MTFKTSLITAVLFIGSMAFAQTESESKGLVPMLTHILLLLAIPRKHLSRQQSLKIYCERLLSLSQALCCNYFPMIKQKQVTTSTGLK